MNDPTLAPIRLRTESERLAYIQGFRAGVDACDRWGKDDTLELMAPMLRTDEPEAP